MEVKVAVLKSFREEKDVTITSVPYDVGRSRAANFIIPHTNVSRKHCQIVTENGSWKVIDWSSSGTFVNDLLIGKGKSAVIRSGDCIRLGPKESGLSWTFTLSPKESTAENCKPKTQTLLNLKNEKELPHGTYLGWKVQRMKENMSEVKTKKSEVEETRFLKNDCEKIQALQKELQQMQSALHNIEEQNSVLQEKLATEMKNKNGGSSAKILENITDLMETEMQCTICSELFVTAVTLSCSHTFCKYCIDQWKKKQKTCPICRTKITKETRSLVVDNYIDKMVGNFSLELKQRREAIIKERKGSLIKKRKFKH